MQVGVVRRLGVDAQMRRLLVLLFAVLSLVRPAFAEDASSHQQDVRQRLAASAAQIAELNVRIADLERSVLETQRRVERERAQVRILARTLYTQPDSLMAVIFQSASLADAMTRIADLTSAGDRAAATKRQLDQDLVKLSEQKSRLQADRERQLQLKKQLEQEYGRLVGQSARDRQPRSQPSGGVYPTDVAVIKQIILDAFAPLGATAQEWALRVAKCESNYNPYAVNRYSGAAGLFQFLPSTWAATPQRDRSPFDPVANSQAAAWLYQRSGPNQWSCR